MPGRSNPRVLFYVQHLQGIGHVVRAKRIAEALIDDGFEVTLILGGMPVASLAMDHLDVIQLPPLRASATSFRELLTADGTVAQEAYKTDRRNRLLRAFEDTSPDILMIEAFPFDRPQMHFELIPLLEQAASRNPSPLIVSSIRDILQRKPKPERDATACDLLDAYFDAVLVHGDPSLATLGETYRHAGLVDSVTHYTGIIAPPPPSAPGGERYDVIISTGGGATDGHLVLEAAIGAKPLSSLADRKWLGLVGPFVGTSRHAKLEQAAKENGVTLLPFVDGLAGLMAHAEVSISQAGYNTVADILRTRCRAVLCPYGGIRQNEQTTRALHLEERGWATTVPWDALAPTALASAIDEAVKKTAPAEIIDLDGAEGTARVLRQLIRKAV